MLAAWLFYTSRDALAELRDTIRDRGFRFGVIDVDPQEGKKKDAVEVQLVLTTEAAPLPEAPSEETESNPSDEQASAQETADAEQTENGDQVEDAEQTEDSEQPAAGADGQPEGDERAIQAQEAMRELAKRMLADDSLERMNIGSTTREAAKRYLKPRDIGEKYWLVSLPELPELAKSIDALLDSSPEVHWVVWHIDRQGILRMAPAKEVKPMSGNVLRVKL